MTDYDKAMMHVELALRRASQSLREGGETTAQDALWIVAGHLAELADEGRRVSATSLPPADRVPPHG